MNPDFVDLLRAFIAADVRFLVVGAYALAVHGRPRATGDLDVWVEATPENAPRVMGALASFGAPLRDLSEPDFARPGVTYQIGVPLGEFAATIVVAGGCRVPPADWDGRQRRGPRQDAARASERSSDALVIVSASNTSRAVGTIRRSSAAGRSHAQASSRAATAASASCV
jgi:hypothetical protein